MRVYRAFHWTGRPRSEALTWPGGFAAALVGVALVVVGSLAFVVGRDVPDGWERTEAEIVDAPQSRRAITRRDLEYVTSDGELVQLRCSLCWGRVGAEVPIAYDPVRPTQMMQTDFHRVPSVLAVLAGVGVLLYAWAFRIRARPRPPADYLGTSGASSDRRRGRSRGRPRP
jgi:Protein of unknown function (DUF3592)